MNAFYVVEINWNGSWVDVSNDVKDIDIQIGISDPMNTTANIGQCTLVLNNVSRKYSPGNVGSPYYAHMRPNKLVRVKWVEGSTYTLFTGVVRSFSAAPGQYGARDATIRCEDYLSVLQRTMFNLPLQEARSTGTLIEMILAQVLGGTAAAAEIRFTAQPAALDTVRVNELIYTFVAGTPTDVYQVKIGATLNETISNLAAAINNGDGANTLYKVNNTRPSGVAAQIIDSYARTVEADRPVRQYRLDEAAGPTALDAGTNGAHGTMTGATVVPNQPGALPNDPAGKSIYFNGSTGRIALPTLDLRNRSFTVELWINPDSASPPAQQTCFGAYVSPGTAGLVFVIRLYSSGNLQVAWGTNDLFGGVGLIPFGVWTKIAVVYDYISDTTSLYKNGAFVTSNAGGPFTGSNPQLNIAARGDNAEYFKGYVDEVAVYWSALSAAQIAAHYAARSAYVGVRVIANAAGTWGNSIPLVKSSAGISLSSATLTGGTNATQPAVLDGTGLLVDMAGDAWTSETTNALRAITDCANTERGLFWQDRDGTLYFRDRHFVFKRVAAAPALTLNSQHRALENEKTAEDLYNEIIVQNTPRGVLAQGVVAKAQNVIAVPGQSGLEKWSATLTNTNPAGGATTVRLPFVDAAGGKIMGAKSIITPLDPAMNDYRASDAADGISGFDYSTYSGLKFSAVIAGSEIEINIKNEALGPLYVAGLQVRGQGIVAYNARRTTRRDATSISAYGLSTLNVDLPLPVEQSFADALADYLLNRYKDPAYRVRSLSFARRTVGAVNLFSLTLGQVVAVTDYQTGITATKYLITGLSYNLKPSGEVGITLAVRALDNITFGLLDDAAYGLLDSTMRLVM